MLYKLSASKAFTLIEITVVMGIISLLFLFFSYKFSGFQERLAFKSTRNSIVTNLRLAQQEAISKKESIDIVFYNHSYTFDGAIKNISNQIKIKNPQIIRFTDSGNPQPGYFGTIVLESKNQTGKIVISPIGRIKTE